VVSNSRSGGEAATYVEREGGWALSPSGREAVEQFVRERLLGENDNYRVLAETKSLVYPYKRMVRLEYQGTVKVHIKFKVRFKFVNCFQN
jgi:hypothetical protein